MGFVEERPLCKCHGEPMHVSGVYKGKRYWRCAIVHRASRAACTPPEKQRAQNRKQRLLRYGLVEEDYTNLLTAQGGACAGCGFVPLPGVQRRLAVDHEHVRGWKEMPRNKKRRFVRGVLCPACNRSLGYARDNAQTLRNLADYLDRYAAEGGAADRG